MTGPPARFATPLLVAGVALVVLGVMLLFRGASLPHASPDPVAADDARADEPTASDLAASAPDTGDEDREPGDDDRDAEHEGTPDVDKEEPTPTDDAAAGQDVEDLIIGFFAAFSTALADGDDAFLAERLHPAVGSRYGAETCQAYLAGLPQQQIGLEVLSIGTPAPWTWVEEIDPIEDAIAVELRRTVAGETDVVEAHVVVQGGEVAWFTECDA